MDGRDGTGLGDMTWGVGLERTGWGSMGRRDGLEGDERGRSSMGKSSNVCKGIILVDVATAR